MNTEAPLYWIKQIETELTDCKKIPLWGNSPYFPFEEFSLKMQTLLQCPTFKIYPIAHEPLIPENALSSFGLNPKILSFELAPITGPLYWVISAESLNEITALLLSKESSQGLLDPEFQQGFYDFLLLQACKEVENLKVYPDLHIQWGEEKKPTNISFLIDVSIAIEEKTFPGRLLLSSEFQKGFATHFLKAAFNPLTSPISHSMDVSLRLEAGSCLISSLEWDSVQEGDFLILDRCSYDPETKKGTLDLTWDKTSLFKVKVKKTNLKILDYAVYNGDGTTMDEEKSFEDQELSEATEHLWDAPLDEELTEDLKEEAPLYENPPDILASTKDIPFQIVVEVDRIKISLEKLLQLQPGNVLELEARPEKGVTLTVNGKKIARGELLKLGDVLGVKIIEVGGSTTP